MIPTGALVKSVDDGELGVIIEMVHTGDSDPVFAWLYTIHWIDEYKGTHYIDEFEVITC